MILSTLPLLILSTFVHSPAIAFAPNSGTGDLRSTFKRPFWTFSPLVHSTTSDHTDNSKPKKLIEPSISIEYCTGCRWLLRSAWFAQELLTTFEGELASVQLIPSKPPSQGGTFVSAFLFD